MHLAAAKRGQRLHGKFGCRVRHSADGQRNEHLVGVQAGVGVAKMLDLQMLDGGENHRGNEVHAVVNPGGKLDRVQKRGARRAHQAGGLAGDEPPVRQFDGCGRRACFGGFGPRGGDGFAHRHIQVQ